MHDLSAVQFWSVMMLLPPLEKRLDLADVLPIAIVLNNTITRDANANVVYIEVYTANDPVVALSEFKPNFYDLLLVDINMPHMIGFELCGKIFAIDINVRVCLMSSGEINWEAQREMYPTRQEGCFIRKPVTIDHLLKRIRSELD